MARRPGTVPRRRPLRHYCEYRSRIDPQVLELRDMAASGGQAEHQRFVRDWANRPIGTGKDLPLRVPSAEEGAQPSASLPLA